MVLITRTIPVIVVSVQTLCTETVFDSSITVSDFQEHKPESTLALFGMMLSLNGFLNGSIDLFFW